MCACRGIEWCLCYRVVLVLLGLAVVGALGSLNGSSEPHDCQINKVHQRRSGIKLSTHFASRIGFRVPLKTSFVYRIHGQLSVDSLCPSLARHATMKHVITEWRVSSSLHTTSEGYCQGNHKHHVRELLPRYERCWREARLKSEEHSVLLRSCEDVPSEP